MPIYLQIGPADRSGAVDPKNAVQGLSSDVGHERWIPITSCTVGKVDIGTSASTGTAKADVKKIREINCARYVDGTSTKLFQMANNGSQPMVAVLDFADDHGDVYFSLKLSDTQLSSFSVSGNTRSTENKPMESFALNFGKLEIVVQTTCKAPAPMTAGAGAGRP